MTESELSHYRLWHGIYGEPEYTHFIGHCGYVKFPNGAMFVVQEREHRKNNGIVPVSRIIHMTENTVTTRLS